MSEHVKLPERVQRWKGGPDRNGRPVPLRRSDDGPYIHVDSVPAILTARDQQWRDGLLGDEAVEVVVDFLCSWRYCPVSQAEIPGRSCLDDAAKQLLAALDKAAPDGGGGE